MSANLNQPNLSARPAFGRSLAWVAGVTLLGAGPALGSDFEAADILSLPWHGFVVRPQFSVSTIATDNVFFGNNSATAQTVYRPLIITNGTFALGPATTNLTVLRAKESDVLSYVSPGVNIEYGNGSANRVFFGYQNDQLIYLNHPAEDTIQHHFTLDSNYKEGAVTIHGRDTYAMLSSPQGGGSYLSLLGLVINRNTLDDAYNFQVDVTEKSAIYVKGSHNSTDYQQGLPIYDTDNVSGTLGWAYSPAALLALTVEGYYGQSAVGSNYQYLSKGPHSEFMGGFVGAKGEFSPKLQGTVKLGVESRDFPGIVNGASIISPAFDVAVTYSATPLTQGTLNYTRRTDLSGYYNGQTLIASTVTLGVQHSLGISGRWIVGLRASWYQSEYTSVLQPISVLATDGSGNVLFDSIGRAVYKSVAANYARTETLLGAGLQISYQPRPWLVVSLSYDFTTYDPKFSDANVAASHPSIDYTDNRATFRIGIGF